MLKGLYKFADKFSFYKTEIDFCWFCHFIFSSSFTFVKLAQIIEELMSARAGAETAGSGLVPVS